jgi:F-type H+-transporting ATPase subunit epsilon
MKSFQIEILTPQKTVYSGKVEALMLKGATGYFGVLAGHAPLIARLSPGRLKLTRNGNESIYQAGAGFVQVGPPAIRRLTDVALPARNAFGPADAGGRAGKERVCVLLDEIKESHAS